LEAEVELKDALAEVAEIRLEYTRVSAPGLGLPVREVEAVTARLEAAEAAAEAREANVKGLERLARKARLRQKGDDPVVAARLEVLQLQVDALRARVATLVVRAPQAGVVSGELPIVGSWVLGGDLLMEVVARGTREAVAWVEVRQARELKPGSVVELQDAMGLVSGTVKIVGPAVDEVPAMLLTNPAQREWRIPVVLHVADRELVPGELLVAEF
jgi:multidrug resistance efflux pump